MLSQLIEQQQLRRKDLKQLLEEMEAQRQNQAADYWLVQYQRLMENIPENIQHAQQYLPSAPSANLESEVDESASAPPIEVFMESQCVICFDSSVSSNHCFYVIRLLILLKLLLISAKSYSLLVDTCVAAQNVVKKSVNAQCAGPPSFNDFKFIHNLL